MPPLHNLRPRPLVPPREHRVLSVSALAHAMNSRSFLQTCKHPMPLFAIECSRHQEADCEGRAMRASLRRVSASEQAQGPWQTQPNSRERRKRVGGKRRLRRGAQPAQAHTNSEVRDSGNLQQVRHKPVVAVGLALGQMFGPTGQAFKRSGADDQYW